jgi:ribosomal-protein-alanine N-acetyltransferase
MRPMVACDARCAATSSEPRDRGLRTADRELASRSTQPAIHGRVTGRQPIPDAGRLAAACTRHDNHAMTDRSSSPLLRTARLTVRPFTAVDAAFIVELLNDPGWLRHIGDRKVRTLDDAHAYLRDGPLAAQERHGFALWAVRRLVDEPDGKPIGMCGLLRREGLDDVDIGYAFLPGSRGQGFAREAAAAVLSHGFGPLGLARIVAITGVDNTASGRVLEAIGMRFERRLRVPGHDADSLLYAASAADSNMGRR